MSSTPIDGHILTPRGFVRGRLTVEHGRIADVQGEPRNERDMLWRSIRDEADRLALTVPFQPVSDGLLARFPIVVAA